MKNKISRIVLVGNPNVGKSAIFGTLTGRYVTVSNYPGTTVELFYGNFTLKDKKFVVIDTPGVNSLIPMSEDEKITRDILLTEKPYTVVQVADSKNMKRTLMILLHLAEMEVPVVLDLNMEDEALDRGVLIDKKKLSEIIGVEVVGTVALRKKGIKKLKDAIQRPKVPSLKVRYDNLIETYIQRIENLLPKAGISKRAISVMILSGDESLRGWLKENLPQEVIDEIERLRDECQSQYNLPLAQVISTSKLQLIEHIINKVLKKVEPSKGKITDILEMLTIHPVFGIFVLIFVIFLLYELVGVLGAGILVDFLEGVIFEKYINPITKRIVELLIPSKFFYEMIVGEYGIVTMGLTYSIAIVLPITATFFIAFSILEDSGYLPRLAVLSNRAFNVIGLNGKAILPMILGLGCGTMAVMTTRVLESRRDRIIATFLLALAIPCSAQLGVILGMISSLSPIATVIWIITIISVIVISGYLAAKVVPGEKTEFLLEIPPLRIPKFSNLFIKTLGRVEWYLREAVPLFILGTFVLFLLKQLKLLNLIETVVSPLVHGILGLPTKTAGFFIMGFLRRDYGAAGLFSMAEKGELTSIQTLISLITITLFVPCLASFFMIIKERGIKVAIIVAIVVFFLAFFVGGIMNFILNTSKIRGILL